MSSGVIVKLGRFVSIGVVATLLYAVLHFCITRFGGMNPTIAAVVAYAGATAFSYVGHRSVTFRSDRAHSVAVPRFLTLSAIGCAIAAGLSYGAERLGLPVEAGTIATCVMIPVLNYLVLDRIVFVRSLEGSPDGA